MAHTLNSFDTEHQGLINYSQWDYYGRRLASASSDGKIYIFETINEKNSKKTAEISGHDSSVWQLAWSHPRFGSLIATCGFDKKVLIWKEISQNKWDKIFEYTDHKNSVNCVSFSPQEYGLILLSGSVDGNISIHEYKNDNWNSKMMFAHGFGVNSISWAPSNYNENEENLSGLNSLAPIRFCTCGMDNLIKIWQTKENRIDSFYVVATLEGHEDSVREVLWRNSKISNNDMITSGGDDGTVYLWTSINEFENVDSSDNASDWKKFELKTFATGVTRLSFDENGSHLAVSTYDGTVEIFKEQSEGSWNTVSVTNSEGLMDNLSDK